MLADSRWTVRAAAIAALVRAEAEEAGDVGQEGPVHEAPPAAGSGDLPADGTQKVRVADAAKQGTEVS